MNQSAFVAPISLEQVVRQTIEKSGAELSLTDLLAELMELGIADEHAVKAAIWRLLDHSEIEMTPLRKLRVQQTSCKVKSVAA